MATNQELQVQQKRELETKEETDPNSGVCANRGYL